MKLIFVLSIFIFCSNVSASPDALYFNLPFINTKQNDEISFQTLPAEALLRLQRHGVWQTAAGLKLTGQSPLLQAQRKWVVREDGSSLRMLEKTALAAAKNCITKRATEWVSAQIDITGPIDVRDFLLGLPNDCDKKIFTPFSIKYLSGDRFTIYPKDSGIAVLFFPSHDFQRPNRKLELKAVNVFTAPGISSTLEKAVGLPAEETAYLHHDLSNGMPVLLDRSFPLRYTALLGKVVDRWNALLGKAFFKIQVQSQVSLDPYDCLSARKLCIFWNGPAELSFLGATGMTSITFDPYSGEILGGYIGLTSDAEPSMKAAPKTNLVRRYTTESESYFDIAKMFSMRSFFKDYLHPQPYWQLEYVLAHELGHFNGLGHNFYGDNSNSSYLTQDSVMDYLPFSAVNSHSGHLGKFDHQMINFIYKQREPDSDFKFCGDDDVSPDGISKNPNCNQFDLGSPETWFISLATVSPEGVFSPHPRFNGVLLDYLGAFLRPSKLEVNRVQYQKVKSFLCKQERISDIVEYLRSKIDYDLQCQ